MWNDTARDAATRLVLATLFLVGAAAPATATEETLRWTRTFEQMLDECDYSTGVAVGPGGRVYVAGVASVAHDQTSNENLLLLQYSRYGQLKWARTFDGEGSGSDRAYGVATGPDGSVYVTGITDGSSEGCRLLVQKYSPEGALVWTTTYDEPASKVDVGAAMAIAPDGGVYVAGNTGYDLLLQRYSDSGSLEWTRTFSRPGSSAEYGLGVAIGPDGSVYVTGVVNLPYQPPRLLAQKYSAAGELRWSRIYAGADQSRGQAVAVGSDGSVYVTGQAGYDLVLQKYSPWGRLRWTRTFDGGSTGPIGRGVALGLDGSIYVVGEGNFPGTNYDLVLQKYSPWGGHIWTKTYNDAWNYADRGSGVAIDADGSIYVGGMTPEGHDVILVQKYK